MNNSGQMVMIKILGVVLVAIIGAVMWFSSTVTIESGMVGIVFQKTGKPDPTGRFIVEKGYKGLQREVLLPGLHVFWQTTLFLEITSVPMTEIPSGKVGVLIAKDGRELADAMSLAEDDRIDPDTGNLLEIGQKGIRKTVLMPGTYPLNTQYFQVQLHDALMIEAGKTGILTRVLGEPAPPDQQFVARESAYRGMIREVLEPGIYYLHPKLYSWEIVDAMTIPDGQVGVVLEKEEGATASSKAAHDILEPGTYHLNPYAVEVQLMSAKTMAEHQEGPDATFHEISLVISGELYDRLTRAAEAHQRTLREQLVWYLEYATQQEEAGLLHSEQE
jgi:hypothetical protein